MRLLFLAIGALICVANSSMISQENGELGNQADDDSNREDDHGSNRRANQEPSAAITGPSRSPPIEGYEKIEGYYIRDNNDFQHPDLTLQRCADRCTNALKQFGYECKSFEYGYLGEYGHRCNLSHNNRATVEKIKFQAHKNFDYFERNSDTEIKMADTDSVHASIAREEI